MSSFSEPLFPVSYSTICEEALLKRLLPQYAISRPIDCTFLRQGLNDTYLVKTAEEDVYLDRHLTFLRKCEKDYLKGAALLEEPPPSKP